MPLARVASWALMTLLVCLWAIYNRRIALERRQTGENDLRTPPQDQRAPL